MITRPAPIVAEEPGPAVERGLRAGAIVLIGVAVIMLVAPSSIAGLFGLEMGPAGDFMTRRYGAAGTVGLGIALWFASDRSAPSAVLAGIAGWFFVQGGVVIPGLLTTTVTGTAWIAALSDPVLGTGALVLAVRLGPAKGQRPTHSAPPR